MATETPTSSRVTRRLHGIALALFALYALNVALGMLAIKGGMSLWRLGDVGEFALVLACMAFFVAGLVAGEAKPGGES